MPELPEVELVVRSLDRFLTGRRITAAHLLRERLAPDSAPNDFSKLLKAAKIQRVHRRGKNILFELTNGRTLLTHLRMSGKFMLVPEEFEHPNFTHAVFELDDGRVLLFTDQRHFGLMKVLETRGLASAKEIARLAPEPFSEEFAQDFLKHKLRTSRRTIKEFLLDQTKVCGLGNIYASEVLFLAGISPRRRADRVKGSSVQPLHSAIRQILAGAIELAGTVIVDPRDIGGSIYGNAAAEVRWKVYDREGKSCMVCGATIRRLVQGGRSTYYCPSCQKG